MVLRRWTWTLAIRTGIEWTDTTWNPVRGCSKVSPGCKHCYAETLAERFRGVVGHPFEHGFDLRLVPENLTAPFGWAQPRRVFVNSMSDLFHEGIEDGYIESVFDVMAQANWHVYQVLTKRAERMRAFVNARPSIATAEHLWLGVSVEDRKYGLPRIEQLRDTAAAVRFLSVEPLLEDLGSFDLKQMDWVIVGGESGPRARPMAPEWVQGIHALCREAKVPFFFKQWGGVQKNKAGRELFGTTYDEFPTINFARAPSAAERARLRSECEEFRRARSPHA